MRKCLGALLITMCLMLTPALVAYADVIVPPENDFYDRYAGYMVYLERGFTPGGDDGSVSVLKSPNGGAEIARAQNGEQIHIQFACLYDGEYWGFSPGYSGWINLGEMRLLYDYIAFEAKHSEEFYSYAGDHEAVYASSEICLWPWPGAGNPQEWTIDGADLKNFEVQHAYRDAEGREWGYVGYFQGYRHFWICLSDPENNTIPAFNTAPEPGVWMPDDASVYTDIAQYAPPVETQPWLLAAILVVTLAVLTGFLLKFFRKTNRAKQPIQKSE